jgi:serine/threonine-protein kinase
MKAARIAALAALAVGLALASCSLYPPITGSGVLVEGTADFQGFTAIKVDSGFEVTVIPDSAYSITVTVDDNILEHVRMEKDGATFEIGLDPWYTYRDVTLKAIVTLPVLTAVELSGGSSLIVVEAATLPPVGSFAAEVSGASSLLLPAISASSLDLELSGASRVTAGGSAGAIDAAVSGASEADLRSLSGSSGDLELSGGSRMWVTLSGLVDAEVTGGSTLYYRGGLSWGHLVVSDGSQLRSY